MARLDSAGREQLLAALISRFNHDQRTPLNTILGWTHLMQKGGLDNLRVKHVAEVIARNSRDQTSLLEDFVDDGRVVLGVLQLQFITLTMDDLVNDAIERLGNLLTLHGVATHLNFDTTEVLVNGDLRRLTRLVYRLMALITRRAREATKLEVETDVDDGHYVLALSGTAHEPDWSEAALLELRISTLATAAHDGRLEVSADATRPCIEVRVPVHRAAAQR